MKDGQVLGDLYAQKLARQLIPLFLELGVPLSQVRERVLAEGVLAALIASGSAHLVPHAGFLQHFSVSFRGLCPTEAGRPSPVSASLVVPSSRR